MAESSSTAGKFTITFGEVAQSQIVVGDYNHVAQSVGLSPQEVTALRAVFGDARSEVASCVAPELRDDALTRTAELEAAVISAQPDPTRVRRVLRWFREHAPEAAGAVVSAVVHPLVGKVVEAAGEAVAGRFRRVLDEEL